MSKHVLVFILVAGLVSACAPSANLETSSNGSTRLMVGEFTYMADAATFRECLSDRTYPVAMEAGYLELERAYLDSRIEPGAPVHVTIKGRILKRPSMEGEPRLHVVVAELGSVDPLRRCAGHSLL